MPSERCCRSACRFLPSTFPTRQRRYIRRLLLPIGCNKPSFDARCGLCQQLIAQDDARSRLAEEALPANKAAVFDALAAAGISSVVVTFDGVGDSGQIESIDARIVDTAAALPTCDIEIATPGWDGSELQRPISPLGDAIEQLAYALLEETHGGWENNEGAFGECDFDVAERTIQLDCNERIESSEYSGHQW